MKKIVILLLCFTQVAYALRSLPDASKRFQDSLNAFIENKNATTAQKVVAEYDSPENTDKYRHTFDSTLQVNKITIAQLRSLAAVPAAAPTKAPAVEAAPVKSPVAPTITTPYEALPKTVPAPTPTPAPTFGRAGIVSPTLKPTIAPTLATRALTATEVNDLFAAAKSAVGDANSIDLNTATEQVLTKGIETLKAAKGKLTQVKEKATERAAIVKEIDQAIKRLATQRQKIKPKAATPEVELELASTFEREPDIVSAHQEYLAEQEMAKAEKRNEAAIAAATAAAAAQPEKPAQQAEPVQAAEPTERELFSMGIHPSISGAN